MSIASHELKTPITSMKLQFQAAERMIENKNTNVFLPAMVEKRITIAIRQLDRMNKLIEDMLDSSRIALDKFQILRRPFDLCKLMAETLDRFVEPISVSGNSLKVDLPRDCQLIVSGDEYRVEQVISNLLNNAIKYGEKRPIVVSLCQLDDIAVLKVKDHGIGISKESIPLIFKRYEIITSIHNVGSLGLNLYISQKIVEEHQGSIQVESEAGRGTTFTVSLPVAGSHELI